MRLKFLVFYLLFAVNVSGQQVYNTSISGSLSTFNMPDMKNEIFVKGGLAITRSISDKFAISIQYQDWLFKNSAYGVVKDAPIESWAGKLDSRSSYRFVDVVALYQRGINNHGFFGGLGLSYAQGFDRYIDGVWLPPGGFDALIEHEPPQFTRHYGVNLTVGYSYYIFKKRVGVGMIARAKSFTSGLKEYDVGVNMSYRFNIFN